MFCFSAIHREDLGLPSRWATIAFWLSLCNVSTLLEPVKIPEFSRKCPEIPKLRSYRQNPSNSFWKIFPKYRAHKGVKKRVKAGVLKRLVQKCWFFWDCHQRKIARQALKTVTEGAFTALNSLLPSIETKNAKSAFQHGLLLTDTIGHWVKNKMVAGPFDKPPFKNFRSNPLMAVQQKTKVRPILNLSAPKNFSFNDAVNEHRVRKLIMSSASLFAKALKRAGKGALMAKYDICDAYKQILGHPSQQAAFGFRWLGKYFYDLTTVFGSKSAPANFDSVLETVVNIVCTLAKVPRDIVHRQLDDVPVISPASTDLARNFADKYVEVCHQVGLPLADDCPKREKSFGIGTNGTVLGIDFDSITMTWKLPASKATGIVSIIDFFLTNKTCNLKEVQKLHGKLSDFAQMSEFMKGFRFQLSKLLGRFENCENTRRLIPSFLAEDLRIWKKAVLAAKNGMPIGLPPMGPPITAVKFISDAAGAAYHWADGKCANLTEPGDRGVASVGFAGEDLFFVGGLKWTFALMTKLRDSRGRLWGSKSSALECIGLVIPFVTRPELMRNKYVILYVDNISLIYAWEKKYCKNDEETSILIRCLHVLEAFLETKIFVEHVKRMSNDMAVLVDHLSRESSTTGTDLARISDLPWLSPGGALLSWISDPSLDWNLPVKIVNDVGKMLTK